MQAQVILTASQSKRLIAKGILKWEPFRHAQRSGIIAICKGTTNSYIVEELLAEAFDKRRYVMGRTAPAGLDTSWADAEAAEVVLEEGRRIEGALLADIVTRMGPGDLFLKGANAINYDLGQAGVLIAHPSGGTLGATMGTIVSRKVRLVHPAGLEKSVPADIAAAARRLCEQDACVGQVYGLWPTHGEIFTEIEAIEALFNIEAVPAGSGGIAGAEGALTLSVFGERAELDRALALIDEIQKEPPFGAGGP